MHAARSFIVIFLIGRGLIAADTVSLSGTIVKTGSTSGIAGVSISLAKLPHLYTETSADGTFLLKGSTSVLSHPHKAVSPPFRCTGKMLFLSPILLNTDGILEFFSANGERLKYIKLIDRKIGKGIALPEFNSRISIIRLTSNGKVFMWAAIRLGSDVFLRNATAIDRDAPVNQASAAIVDTLIAARECYSTKKVPIDGYDNHSIAITLDSICPNLQKDSGTIFKISMDSVTWSRWEFRYPVTYTFGLTDISAFTILRRDADGEAWQTIPIKHPGEFFNGVDAARLDTTAKTAYISVGFNTRPQMYLKFQNNPTASYIGTARFYDNRKVTYTLSIDNWAGEEHPGGNPGKSCKSMTDDGGDKYQAAVWACHHFNLPVSAAINTGKVDMKPVWPLIQAELNAGTIEPAVHTRTHPCIDDSDANYQTHGYEYEIIGCRDDLMANLTNIPFGNHIFEFIVPCGYENSSIYQTSKNQFLFLRFWSHSNNPSDTIFAPWDTTYNFYYGGLQTKSYDMTFQDRNPPARYYAEDVSRLDSVFNIVYTRGGIFYAMWHPDRYTNSVIYDNRKPVEGQQGSTLMQHFSHVANRTDVWYVANGWMYLYHRAAELAVVGDVSKNR